MNSLRNLIILLALILITRSSIYSYDWSFFALENKSVLSFEVDPTRDSIFYAGTNDSGLFVSRDGGKTWDNVLTETSVYSIAINRKNLEMIMIGTENGVLLSKNGGTRFESIAEINYNGKSYSYNGVGSLVFDETPTQAIIAGIDGGLFKSFNFGRTWEPAGLEDYEITTLSIDNSGRKAVIYAGTAFSGIFMSANYGLTWKPVNEGINDLSINSILCDRKLNNIVYAGTLGGGVYVSKDNGNSWQMISIELNSLSGYILEQSIDPSTNRSVIFLGNHNGEVYVTEDGGESFEKIGNNIEGESVISFGCTNVLPSTLYIGTNKGLYYLIDRAKNDEQIESE